MSWEYLISRSARAVALRLEGKSLSQIAEAMGTRGGYISRWLRGVPPPSWTKRPRAKDEYREQAVALRLEGKAYSEIARLLPVSKSTLSVWLRDVPLTDAQTEALKLRQLVPSSARGKALMANRVRRDDAIMRAAAAQIGKLSPRELFIAGVVAYWAEGSKSKPWRRARRVQFINSDADMIRLFLRWLEVVGITREQLLLRVNIHETADVHRATSHWSEVVGVPTAAFSRPVIKRHNPRTVRKNVGESYHGCLTVTVRCSTDLHLRIEGWWRGIVRSVVAVPTTLDGSALV